MIVEGSAGVPWIVSQRVSKLPSTASEAALRSVEGLEEVAVPPTARLVVVSEPKFFPSKPAMRLVSAGIYRTVAIDVEERRGAVDLGRRTL